MELRQKLVQYHDLIFASNTNFDNNRDWFKFSHGMSLLGYICMGYCCDPLPISLVTRWHYSWFVLLSYV